jgi:hypothetical protein
MGTREYTYGPAGHLEHVTAGANQVLFASDDEGRLSALSRPAAGASALFTYDGRSFLSQATAPPEEIFADGVESGDLACWSQVAGGAGGGTCCPTPPPAAPQVIPTYSSEGLLYALESGGTFQEVFYLAGRPVAQRDSATSELLFLTTDHLGTPVLATDEAGLEVWSGGFEPFGEDYLGAQAAGVFLRFPGQWVDGVWEEASLGAGVFYNVHRWHQSDTGRYARPDPVNLGRLENAGRPNDLPIDTVDAYYLSILRAGNPRFEHAYGYVAQNSLLFGDPLGLFGPGALATAGGACVAVDGPAPIGDVVGVPLLLVAGVWVAGVAIVDWWDNRDKGEPCEECEIFDTCRRLLDLCLANPKQPERNRPIFGPKKDCGACFRECRGDGGAWPFYKCPLL